MTGYLLRQYKDRRGMGRETLYQELKNFCTWWAAEYEGTSPMAGIPAPAASQRGGVWGLQRAGAPAAAPV